IVIIFEDGSAWVSSTDNTQLQNMENEWFENDVDVNQVISQRENLHKQVHIDAYDIDIMMVGTPIPNYAGAVYVYQSLDVIEQTKAETTRIILLAAGIAIVLTTIFAFFLSTRITAPLIRMREAAIDLTRGEFNTKVPILTNDEIGELGIAFNKMGKQLNFHIQALRQEKEQLASIVSSMADGVLTLNRQGDIIMINPTAQQFIEDCHFERYGDHADYNLPLPEELEEILGQIIQGEQEVLQEVSLQGRNWVMIMTRSEEHTSELQSRFDIFSLVLHDALPIYRQGDIIMINPTAQQFIEDCHFERYGDHADYNLPLPEELEEILGQIIQGEQEVLQEVSLQGRNWVMIMT